MLKLRLEKGIDLNDYQSRFNARLENTAGAEYLLKHRLIEISAGRFFIRPDKFYVMNSIILKLL